MKPILLLLIIISFNFKAVCETDYRSIPLAQQINLKVGLNFEINENVRIVVGSKTNANKKNAEFLQNFLYEKLELYLKITNRSKNVGMITLVLDTAITHPEGYRISIEKKSITIAGKTEAGIFYGIQTLCKNIPVHKGKVHLPPVEISDAPRFNYRGMHLDVARHFFSVDFLKKYIDILSLHNVNTFHLHLTDDQGWRIEIKKYPLLTKIGSKRAQTVVGHRTSGIYDSVPYSGYYTQKQIKEIVRYADERYITIVPEIDMPGHMLAALAAYPELGCTGGPYKVAETWGIFNDVLCAGNEKVYTFVQDVLTEIMRLFPSKYIHIGGDECLKTNWEACPKCQQKVKNENLQSDSIYTVMQKLQSNFIKRIEKFVYSKGRQIIGWDEILEGGLALNAVVMSWRGEKGGIEAARLSHQVIMTPYTHLYFDYNQSSDPALEPFAIGYVPVQNVYNYEPIPAELKETEASYIIGVQANLWTEYITSDQHAEYMLLPRLAALSEVQWTKPELRNYQDFLIRLPILIEIYQKRGYNFAKHVLNTVK